MSAQERFNQVTGRTEFFIQVEGIPGGYWTPLDFAIDAILIKSVLGLQN